MSFIVKQHLQTDVFNRINAARNRHERNPEVQAARRLEAKRVGVSSFAR